VTILSDDITISDGAFSSCNKLNEIILSENNNNYQVKEGVVFSKDGSTLIQYPCGLNDTYVIPTGVISIQYDAFSGCSSLRYVTFQSGAIGMPSNVFKGCNNLIAINYLGDSDPGIIHDPFSSCQSLELLCVPSYYSNNTLFTRNDIFRTDSCDGVLSQIDQCFGVVLGADGTPIVGLRKNMSAIEEERKKCVKPICEKRSECEGENAHEQICDSYVCIDCEQCEKRKWKVIIDIDCGDDETCEFSATEIITAISDVSNVDPNKISIVIERDEDERITRIILYTGDERNAKKVETTVNDPEGHQKGILRWIKEARVEAEELSISEAPDCDGLLTFIFMITTFFVAFHHRT